MIAALDECGYETEAERLLGMLRARVEGDYLQTSAIFTEDMRVLSLVTDPNDYAGPGTGYRMSRERHEAINDIRQARTSAFLASNQRQYATCLDLIDLGPAEVGEDPRHGQRVRDVRLPTASRLVAVVVGVLQFVMQVVQNC